MKYTAPRDMTVSSTCGLSVELKKGEPKMCSPEMHDDLVQAGCIPSEALPEPEVAAGKTAEPTNKAARYDAICVAFKAVALRNVREEFNAVGAPHAAVLATELGWSISGKDRDAAWAKWQDETAPA